MLEQLAVESEIALTNSQNNHVSNCLKSNHSNSNQKVRYNTGSNIIRSIENKSIENNLFFARADKRKTVVNRQEYLDKTINFVDPNKYKILEKDPIPRYQKAVRVAIINSPGLFNDKYKCKLLIMNPQPPKLHSLIELHKEK